MRDSRCFSVGFTFRSAQGEFYKNFAKCSLTYIMAHTIKLELPSRLKTFNFTFEHMVPGQVSDLGSATGPETPECLTEWLDAEKIASL